MIKRSAESVAAMLNEWYSYIRKNKVEEAEFLKNEIFSILDEMEENQDVLLYYSLLDFRHQIMLSYLKPESAGDVNNRLKQLEDKKDELTGLLDYYFYFFKGMYHLKQRDYLTAIGCYKNAETKLKEVKDEIERAEFHLKIAEAYYYMQQTPFSMNYAMQALEIFKQYDLYTIKRVQCRFIIGGNLIDVLNYDKAKEFFREALMETKNLKEKDLHLQATAYFNLGLCSFYENDYENALENYLFAADIYEEQTSFFLPKVFLNLMRVRIKQNQFKEAENLYEKGIDYAIRLKDEECHAKFMLFKATYLQYDEQLIIESFQYFESKNLFSDLEELSLDVANYYTENQNFDKANSYYRKAIFARQQIQKGECHYEI
ncbi:Rap family tetratricopeptide repeat protein [Bacillus gobiensis]|uniref:response regulator aspartate phosphatase n=1 Tax=Bacillus gobiensis TaxID=1441095 RepID=UPI003D24A8D0